MSKPDFALALAAGIGIGAVGVYLLTKRKAASTEEEIKTPGYLWKRPTLVNANVLNAHEVPKEEIEGVTAAKKLVEETIKSKCSDSSSHLSANHLATWQDDPESHPHWPRGKEE